MPTKTGRNLMLGEKFASQNLIPRQKLTHEKPNARTHTFLPTFIRDLQPPPPHLDSNTHRNIHLEMENAKNADKKNRNVSLFYVYIFIQVSRKNLFNY